MLAAQAEPLSVVRSLTISERAVALALAISLDNDYFSRHSHPGYVDVWTIWFHLF